MGFLEIFLLIVMLAAVAGMIFCRKRQETFALAQQAAAGLLAVIFICVGILLWRSFGNNDQNDLIDSELRFAASRGDAAAAYMANKGVKSVAIIVEPTQEKSRELAAVVEAIKDRGIENVNVVVVQTDPSADFYMAVSKEALADAFRTAGESDGIIVQAYLPGKALRIPYWKEKNSKPVIFMTRPDFQDIDKMLKNNLISGLICDANGVDYDKEAPGNLEKAFKIRYVLVTRDNMNENKSLISN